MKILPILLLLIIPNYGLTQNDSTLAKKYYNVGDSLSKLAKYEQSIDYFNKSGTLYKALAGKYLSTDSIRFWSNYVHCQYKIAFRYGLLYQFEKAIHVLEEAEKNTLSKIGSESKSAAHLYNIYGVTYRKQGKYEKAMLYYSFRANKATFSTWCV